MCVGLRLYGIYEKTLKAGVFSTHLPLLGVLKFEQQQGPFQSEVVGGTRTGSFGSINPSGKCSWSAG